MAYRAREEHRCHVEALGAFRKNSLQLLVDLNVLIGSGRLHESEPPGNPVGQLLVGAGCDVGNGCILDDDHRRVQCRQLHVFTNGCPRDK